ncbi:MAG: winged helix-turn-helix transcriptional regulator [Candidatus Aenigmarchaeota archaeon]|nr:winged helix-turn-helix transcriptional regulator [Candidatus Aenigmarchaeota archaeon]
MRLKFFVLSFLILLPLTHAERVRNLTFVIDIDEKNEITFDVYIRFTEELKEIRIPVPSKVEILETKGGECSYSEGIIKELVCKPPSPFMVGEISLSTKFRMKGLIKKFGNVSLFSFDIPIAYPTDNVKVEVVLPRGMFVSDAVEMPLSPSGSYSTVKEKRIIEIWEFSDKDPGDIIPIRVYYELSSQPINDFSEILTSLRVIIVVIVIGFAGAIFYFSKKLREKKEEVLSILNLDEKIIVDLIRSHGGKIDQRELVKFTDFSKAKVSRIIKDLKERGIVEVERRGRKNKVYLKEI